MKKLTTLLLLLSMVLSCLALAGCHGTPHPPTNLPASKAEIVMFRHDNCSMTWRKHNLGPLTTEMYKLF